MQYLSLIHICFVNDRQVNIAIMFITSQSDMACSTLVCQLSMNMAMVSLTIGKLILRLWVCRYDRLWHAVPWSVSFQWTWQCFVNDRQVDIAVMGISLRSVEACSTLVWQLLMNVAMVSFTMSRLILRLWVYRYDRLWRAVAWSDRFQRTWQWLR